MVAAEKLGRKRGRTSATSTNGGCDDTTKQPTRRQKRAALAAAKLPSSSSSSSSSASKGGRPSRGSNIILAYDVSLETLLPQRRIDLIADLSESILEDPVCGLTSARTDAIGGGVGVAGEDEVDGSDKKTPLYRKTPSKLHKLLDLASLVDNGHDAHAARLGLLSLMAIFQDILPTYRIRLPTESEMQVRVSKETKATWDHERRLLQCYQRYLQLLEQTWEEGRYGRKWAASDERGKNKKGRYESGSGGQPPTTLAATAILALSSLLRTCYNFNFRTNLLRIVIRQANRRSNVEVRTACCDALSAMIASDVQGDASLEAVRMMSKMIKENNNDVVHPDALNTWLSLPLRVHEDEAAAARLAAAAKAKKAKKSASAKEQFDIEREMKEGEATVDRIELAKNQADTLHAVTLAYFRILKSVSSKVGDDEGVPSTASGELVLLPCALRGLAKFSHLIHLDAVVDLLTVIRDLLMNASSLPPDVAINCILCALKTLRGPGRETLPVDPKEYLIPLYNILPRLGTTASITREDMDEAGHGRSSDGMIEAAIQCLDHAFLHRRELSTSRLAAFVKRIITASIHCPPHSSVPLLACARQISSRYSNSSSKLSRMLENEEDAVADGVFIPDAEDPEHSNAHATSFWELSLMKYAVHPAVAEQSAMMAEGRQLKLPAESPCRLLSNMCRDVQEGFVSSNGTVTWKKHPLDKSISSNEATGVIDGSRSKRRQQRRNQDQIRFITPRRTGNWHLLPTTSWSLL